MITGSQLLVYENAGHGLHWEEPERLAADVTAFVKSPGI
jgi:pimeloyl-ACP methyl ester carboxylesterase